MCQVPAWLVSISVGGMTYQNSQQARTDLIMFGASPFINCIQETLSLDTVTPKGRHVEFDVQRYLEGADIMHDIPVEGPIGEPAND